MARMMVQAEEMSILRKCGTQKIAKARLTDHSNYLNHGQIMQEQKHYGLRA